ncbi:hypothetical protein PG999_002014 [Apiospora kogelbergensis]|uniref:NAD-dependent epimerase/dehydratase domain-containing protein n=1 Tax=Apiospora kogelbergensis TaxID=1337665 RepID=A0AAW0R762_9PEZI
MAPKILITGLNGYLAGRTAEAVLKAGYDVRGTVRRLAAGNEVKDALVKMGYSEDRIEVVEVPDVTVSGAFDHAVAGCHAVLHLASPVGEIFETPAPEVVRKATSSTQEILDSALAHGGEQLKSLVYMSSTAAMFEVDPEPRRHDETDWNTTAEREVQEKGADAGVFNAYCAAKTASEKLVWRFREEKKPKFSVTAVQASYFFGPPVVPWPTKEQIALSISPIWQVVSGIEPQPLYIYQSVVDVRDVARVLVWAALRPDAADGERILCSGSRAGGQAIADILAKYTAGKKEWEGVQLWKGNPGKGYAEGYGPYEGELWLDASKAVEMTGQDWIPLETSVVDSAEVFRGYL